MNSLAFSVSFGGRTPEEKYLSVIRHLASDLHALDAGDIRQIISHPGTNPLDLASDRLTGQMVRALEIALSKIMASRDSFDQKRIAENLESLLGETHEKEVIKADARQETASILAPILLNIDVAFVKDETFFMRRNGEMWATSWGEAVNLTSKKSFRFAKASTAEVRADFYETAAGKLYLSFADRTGAGVYDVDLGQKIFSFKYKNVPNLQGRLTTDLKLMPPQFPLMGEDPQGDLTLVVAPSSDYVVSDAASNFPVFVVPMATRAVGLRWVRWGDYKFKRSERGAIVYAGWEYLDPDRSGALRSSDFIFGQLFPETHPIRVPQEKAVGDHSEVVLYSDESGKPSFVLTDKAGILNPPLKGIVPYDMNGSPSPTITFEGDKGQHSNTLVKVPPGEQVAQAFYVFEKNGEAFLARRKLAPAAATDVERLHFSGEADVRTTDLDVVPGPEGEPLVLVWENDFRHDVKALHTVNLKTGYVMRSEIVGEADHQKTWVTSDGRIYVHVTDGAKGSRRLKVIQVYGPLK
jgi:hypothetical protein